MAKINRLYKRRVFLDSSCFLSLINPHDIHHQEARRIWIRLTQERFVTFTTNFVVAETHALFLIRLGHRRATSFLHEIVAANTVIVRLGLKDEEDARSIVFKYDDKDFSLIDAASFVVMERLHIPYVFTFDRNFVQYGINTLSAD